MKKIFILAIASLSLAACRNANTKTTDSTEASVAVGNDSTKTAVTAAVAPEEAPKIAFEREVYDFGKIVQGEKVQHDFKLKNTGKTPLIITDATATCGCTVPEIPKEPILPGAESIIKVIFNSEGKLGLQDKIITITSNALPAQSAVHIVGEIVEKK